MNTANQVFRWISVHERLPSACEVNLFGIVVHPQCYTKDWFLGAGGTVAFDHRITHWAPIPPAPEKSQNEKDEELWQECKNDWPSNLPCMGERAAFLAGLKAARSVTV